MSRNCTYHMVLERLVRALTTMFILLMGMATFNLAGCEPASGTLPDEDGVANNGEEEGEEIESQEFAITGMGLPTGCNGGEQRYEASYPVSWERDGTHLRIIFALPNYNWCWISVHGRVYTDNIQGGADNWTAVLRNDYYGGGWDRLEVLIPKTFWWQWYSYYRWVLGFSSNDSYNQVAALFWAWGYWQ